MWPIVAILVYDTAVAAVPQSIGITGTAEVMCDISPSGIAYSVEGRRNCKHAGEQREIIIEQQ